MTAAAPGFYGPGLSALVAKAIILPYANATMRAKEDYKMAKNKRINIYDRCKIKETLEGQESFKSIGTEIGKDCTMVSNMSRSSLHRELKKLETDGIITYDPPTIEIHDSEALQNVLSK